MEKISDMIKTFEDACDELGSGHPLVKQYYVFVESDDSMNPEAKELIAYLELRIICEALNKGWQPNMANRKYAFYPWFGLHSKTEAEHMRERDGFFKLPKPVGGVAAVSYAFSDRAVQSYNHLSHRLCLKNKKLAEYCGKQFIENWANYVVPQQESKWKKLF